MTEWGELPGVDIELLHAGPDLSVTSWSCRQEPHRPGSEKFQERLVVVFLQSGSFQLRRRQHRFLLDATTVAYFNPRDPFATDHPVGCGDRGCSLVVEKSFLTEILAASDPATLDRHGAVFPMGVGACPPRAYLIQSLLVSYLRSTPEADSLLAQETALALAEEVIAAPLRARGGTRGLREEGRETARDLVEEVKRQVLLHLDTGISLQDISAFVGASPFHVCRVFKRSTGMTIHRYLTGLRLRAAVEAVGVTSDLTGLALDLGYSSHSHFTARFHREFGLTPSALRHLQGSRHGLGGLPAGRLAGCHSKN